MSNYTAAPNSLPEWIPGQDICIIIADASKKPRTQEEINDMFDILRCACQNVGFDLSAWGLRPSFERSIDKRYVRDKIAEAIKARDLQLASSNPEFEFLRTDPPPLPDVDYRDRDAAVIKLPVT